MWMLDRLMLNLFERCLQLYISLNMRSNFWCILHKSDVTNNLLFYLFKYALSVWPSAPPLCFSWLFRWFVCWCCFLLFSGIVAFTFLYFLYCFCTFCFSSFWHMKCLWVPYKALYKQNALFIIFFFLDFVGSSHLSHWNKHV